MRILVSGGLGFVGINLVQHLASFADVEVIAADVLEPDSAVREFLQPVSKRVSFYHLDVSDGAAYQRLARECGASHVVHAAAITPDPEYERDYSVRVVEVNLIGSLNALALAYQLPQVERVLLISSSGVYGAPPAGIKRQSERGRLNLDNLYAVTKISAEMVADRYGQLSSKGFAAVRLASVYGPMERPSGSRQHMSHFQRLRVALRESRRVRVWGADLARDWVYVWDVAEAIHSLLRAADWNHTVYNVGAGRAYPFRQVVNAFVAHGLQMEWVDAPLQAEIAIRPEGVRAALDIRRLKKDTGFTPHYDLDTGVEAYLQAPS